MTDTLHLADRQTVADFRTFTARARANDDGGMHLVAAGRVLAAYVRTLAPTVLGEAVPTVLGLRTMALTQDAELDRTVALGSVLDRLAHLEQEGTAFPVPPVPVIETWAGVLPPRSGWSAAGSMPCDALERAAREGIAQVAQSLPTGAGAPLVSSARIAVWGSPLDGVSTPVPAGAAFGAFSLGFLAAGEEASLFTNGRWSRLSTSRGHVLARAAAVL